MRCTDTAAGASHRNRENHHPAETARSIREPPTASRAWSRWHSTSVGAGDRTRAAIRAGSGACPAEAGMAVLAGASCTDPAEAESCMVREMTVVAAPDTRSLGGLGNTVSSWANLVSRGPTYQGDTGRCWAPSPCCQNFGQDYLDTWPWRCFLAKCLKRREAAAAARMAIWAWRG